MSVKLTFDDIPHELKRKVLAYLVHSESCIQDKFNAKAESWEIKVMLVVNFSPMGLHIYEPLFHHAVADLRGPNDLFNRTLREMHRQQIPVQKRKIVEDLKTAKAQRQKVLDSCEHRMVQPCNFDHKRALLQQ